MSPDGVHENEMPRLTRNSASDDEWPAGDPALASFAEDLRVVAGGPAPEPRPGLLAAMRQGPLVSIEPPAATGRKKMLAKTLLGGLVAKVALGAGVAAASVTAAGAAGVLPEPAQQAVASVVAATTPFSLPDPSDVTLQVVDDPEGTTTTSSTTTTVAGEGTGGTGAVGGDTTGRTVNHGACVSAAARDKAESEPGSHGKTVSSIARSDCGKAGAAGADTTSTTGGSSTTSTSTTSTTVDDGQRSANRGPGNSGSGGNGNSGSGGNGNSGSGSANSGRGNSGRN